MLSTLKEVFSNSIDIFKTNKTNFYIYIYRHNCGSTQHLRSIFSRFSPESLSKIGASGAHRICASYATCFLPQLAAPSFLLLPSS